jgi:hypothetical protein
MVCEYDFFLSKTGVPKVPCVDGKTSTDNIREALGMFVPEAQLGVPDRG